MTPQAHQLFATFCEGCLAEDSTTMDLIQNAPGGTQVIKKLHTDMKLAHDQNYKQIDKISWSELKDSYRGAWVIIQGDKGTGAIKAAGGNTGSYSAVASSGGEVTTQTKSRGGDIIDFLKGQIGGLRKFYVGKNSTAVSDKQKQRQSARAGAATTQINQETLVKKFKPLWVRAMTAAIADIKGHIANQIKNDAFEKAAKKLEQVSILQRQVEQLEAGTGEDIPGNVNRAVSTAIVMAASHYYPEQTGNIERSYGSTYVATRSEGTDQLLKDIAAGDTAKLGTILSFFKRALISG
jgi:hypothetical protein